MTTSVSWPPEPPGEREEPTSSASVPEPPAQADDVFIYEQEPAEEPTEATVYTAAPGLPGRGVIVATTLTATGCFLLDFALTGALTFFFDLCFVVICLVAAMSVRRADVFTAGVLPPLVFGAVIAAIALVVPTTFVEAGSLSRTFLTGLAGHAGALVAGYGIALLTVGMRVASTKRV